MEGKKEQVFFRIGTLPTYIYVDDTIVLVYGACAVEGLPTSVECQSL